jgi:hypothetical protein
MCVRRLAGVNPGWLERAGYWQEAAVGRGAASGRVLKLLRAISARPQDSRVLAPDMTASPRPWRNPARQGAYPGEEAAAQRGTRSLDRRLLRALRAAMQALHLREA